MVPGHQSLHVSICPPWGKVLLDFQERKNVLFPELVRALAHQVRLFEDHPEVKVIMLGSVSPQVFSAGVDLRFMGAADPSHFETSDALGGDWRIFSDLRKPLISVIQGYCLGGGLELALMADIMVVGTQAKLGFPEVKLGLMPGLGGTQRLARLIGVHRAALWVLSGRILSAQDAFASGIGSCLVEDACVWSEAEELACTIASYSPHALCAIKTLLRTSQETSLSAGLQTEKEAFYRLLKTSEAQEHLQAFLYKSKS